MKKELAAIARSYPLPCYAYDWDAIAARASEIRNAFGGRFALSYAVKANPNFQLLQRLSGEVQSLDVSSGGEVALVKGLEWDMAKVSFTGPGKTANDLHLALELKVGHVVIESLAEAEALSALAVRQGRAANILVRISPASMPPGFGVSMAGRPSPFGVDEEVARETVAQILRLPGLVLDGFHIYAGTQCLKAEAVAENYANSVRIFRELSARFDLRPKVLVFGSGLGIPYYPEDQALDLAAVAGATNPLLDALRGEPRIFETTFVLELGRYLVGEAGYYLTRVVHVKESRGAKIAVCDGGMNHHLAACGHMGTVIPRNYRMFRVPPDGGARDGEQEEIYELVGPLCTSIDRLGRKVSLPKLQAGDVIAIECSGAYGLTASPMHFISHPVAREVIFTREGGRLQTKDVSSGDPFFQIPHGPLDLEP